MEEGQWKVAQETEKSEEEVLEERGTSESLDIGRAKMVERLCEGFKSSTLLSNDGNLKNKN